MSIENQEPNKNLGTDKKAKKVQEHEVTHGQIGDTTVSDMPKKGQQTGRTDEDKAGKGY